MPNPFERKPKSIELSPETLRHIDTLFSAEDRERAKALLYGGCDNKVPEIERCRIAALKFSDGNLSELEQAVELARIDYRDLLMATGFAHDVTAHLKWDSKPASEPPEIDVALLVVGVHGRISAVLSPIGFDRHDDDWTRNGEVAQKLHLLVGLTSRVETRLFLRLTLESKPVGVMLQLPMLPRGIDALSSEQGYIFRVGDREDALYEAAEGDLARYARPWFERFTTSAEVQRGFEDGTFKMHVKVKDQAIVFWTR